MAVQNVDYTVLKNKGIWMTPADNEGVPYPRRTQFVKLLHRRRYPEGREPVGIAHIQNFSNTTLHLYIDEPFTDQSGILFRLLEPVNLSGGGRKQSRIGALTYQYFHQKRGHLWSTDEAEVTPYSSWQDEDQLQLETATLTPADLSWADPVWGWDDQDQGGVWLFEVYIECTGGSEKGYADYVSENSEDLYFKVESNETLGKLYLTSEERSGCLVHEITLKPGLRFSEASIFYLPARSIRIPWSGLHSDLIKKRGLEVWQ